MKIDPRHFTGQQAGSAKYDVLTALSLIGFNRGGGTAISILRLIGLVTARYNWRLDELCVCQRDMARIWNVTERTAKREVKAWVDERLMIRTRVGVRGRAGAYRLDMVEIRAQAAALWPRIGPDYVERMAPAEAIAPEVMPSAEPPVEAEGRAEGPAARGTWRAVSRRIRAVDPAVHAAWIAPLRPIDDDGHILRLSAPTRFGAHYVETHFDHLLAEAVQAEMGPGRRVVIYGAEEARGT